MASSTYYNDSRAPRYSILFVAPLLLLYEGLAWLLANPSGPSIRNGADVILKSMFIWLGGRRGLLLFEVLLVGIGIWLVSRDWRKHPGPLRPRVFATMFAESAALAVVLGVVLRLLTATFLHYFTLFIPSSPDTGTKLMISFGAGIYEELLFRVIVVGALAVVGVRVLHLSTRGAGIMAAVVGALLFSAFHYIGSLGDTFQLASFMFRFFAGLAFSALYLTRGFGVTAWTHALYDVFVTLASL